MHLKKTKMMIFILRLVAAVIFGSVGNFLARSTVPPNLPIEVPAWTGFAATVIFAAAGFISPNIVSFLAKAGIVKLAQELPKHIPTQVRQNPIKIRLRKNKADSKNQIVLDTSAIVDGRVFEIAKTGFLATEFVIIPQVLSELQYLADSQDSLRRARGRKALDLLGELKKEKGVKVKIMQPANNRGTVDEKLVDLAQKLKASILTCDYNLGKVAKFKNVRVLNVNELAQAVRAQILPGEQLKISLVHSGKTKTQGVGYLQDGTMVVVEDGAVHIGKEVEISVHRSLQTVAGRMIFGRVLEKI